MVSVMVEDLTDVTIRPATVADAAEIAEVHIASWREAYHGVVAEDYLAHLDLETRTAWWRDELDRAGRATQIWVAQDDGRIVGFASLGPSLDEDADRDTMQIYTIYLEPSSWGLGVARELMRTLLAAVPAGAPVTLWVMHANQRARHFYRRHGFTPDGVDRVEDVGGAPFRELRYRRG